MALVRFRVVRYRRLTAMTAPLFASEPKVMSGALCFAGTRFPVKTLFEYFEGKSSMEDFLDDFPTVSREVAVAVLEDARKRLDTDAIAA
jgi:uncharacterized protein (DUF433 family)